MSKNVNRKKIGSANGLEAKQTDNDRLNGPKNMQKHVRSNNGENMTVGKEADKSKQMPMKAKKVKKSVKHRIEFDKSNEQDNNNASRAEVSGNAYVYRTRGMNNSHNLSNKNAAKTRNDCMFTSDSRVQWTREFMEKVRKSNEKHKQKSGLKNVKNVNVPISLQKGDGIQTGVKTDRVEQIQVEELDLLDYEDDLSIEDDEILDDNPDSAPEQQDKDLRVVESYVIDG